MAGGLCCLAAVQGFLAGVLQAEQPKTRQTPPRARFPPWCPVEVFAGGGKGMGKTRPPSVGLSVVFCLHRWVFGGGKKKSLKLVPGDYSRRFFTFLKSLSPNPRAVCGLKAGLD